MPASHLLPVHHKMSLTGHTCCLKGYWSLQLCSMCRPMLNPRRPAMDACLTAPAAGVGCCMQPCLCICGTSCHCLIHWPPGCRPMLPLMAPPWMCVWRSMRMWLVAMRSSLLSRQGTGSADSQWARSTRPTCGRSVRAGQSLLVHVSGRLPAVLDLRRSASDEH